MIHSWDKKLKKPRHEVPYQAPDGAPPVKPISSFLSIHQNKNIILCSDDLIISKNEEAHRITTLSISSETKLNSSHVQITNIARLL